MHIFKLGTTGFVLAALTLYLNAVPEDRANAAEDSAAQTPAAQQPAQTPAKKESKITAPEVTIKVLDRGAEPRKALRYRFAPGKKSTVVMEMKMAMTIEMAGVKQPEMEMPVVRTTMMVDNKQLTPDGTLRYEFKLTAAEVLPNSKAMPQVVSAMDGEMKKLIGLSGYAVVNNRGVVKDASVSIPPVAGQHVEQLVNDIRQLAAPLPEEALGKGAKWEVRMPVNMWSLNSSQVLTYTLVEIKGDAGKFAVALELTAPAQKIESPNMTAGTEMYLEFLKSIGSGIVEFDLTRLVPISNMTINTSMSMNVSAAGTKQNIKSTMNMEMKIGPK
jgi:hypothetical protein